MSRCTFGAALLLTSLTFAEGVGPEAVWGAAPFGLSASVLKTAGLGSAPKDEGVDVLLLETLVTLDAQGRKSITYRTVFRVLRPDAVHAWASLGAVWAPWYEERPQLRARVVTAEGREVWLDPKTISEKAAFDDSRARYSDMKSLVAPLPALAAGAVVEQEIVTKESKPPFPAGNAGRIFFHRQFPVRRYHLRFELPESQAFRAEWSGVGMASVKPSEAKTGGLRRIEVSLADPEWRGDTHAGTEIPHVAYTTGTSWTEVARTYRGWLDEAAKQGVDLSELVSKAKALKTRTQKVQAALTWLQKRVRYTGLELSEGSLVPWSPAQVWERQYGDCKDMALFLVKSLEALGVKAQVALLSVGGTLDVPERLPGFGLFDHALVYLPKDAKNPALWIDATHPGLPVGELPSGDLERNALVLSEDASALTQTPSRLSQRSGLRDTVRIALAGFGAAHVNEQREYLASAGGSMRLAYRDLTDEKLKETFASRARGYYRGERFEVSQKNTESEGGPFTTTLDVQRAELFLTDWDRARVTLPDVAILENLNEFLREPPVGDDNAGDAAPTAPRPRGAPPFSWREPLWLQRTFVITPPRGFIVDTLPESSTTPLGPCLWTATFTKAKTGTVEANFRFEPNAADFKSAEVVAFRRDLQALLKAARPTVTFRHEALSLVSADKAVEGVNLLRALLAREPDDALNRARLATSLLDLGLGGPARAEAARAVRDAPEEVAASMAQGFVAAHDLFGRSFRPGYDRALALTSLEIAVAKDKGSVWARREYARALERDLNGDLISRGPDSLEALRQYQLLALEQHDNASLAPLIDLLWRLRRFEALVELTMKVKAEGLEEKALASVAIVTGPKAAAARAREKWPDSQERARALLAASQLLLHAREYDVAREWLALAKGELPAEVWQQLGALVGKLTRAPAVRDLRTPEAALRSFISLPLEVETSSAYLEKLRPMLSTPMRAHVDELLKRSKSDGLAAARVGFEPSAREVMLLGIDSLLSLADVRAEGSDAAGYRVRAVATVGGRKVEVKAYFVREGKELRLLAVENAFGAMGERILDLLGQQKVEAARVWANWAAEALPEVRSAHVLGFHQVWPPTDARSTADALRIAGALLAVDTPETLEAGLAVLSSETQKSAGTMRVKLLRAAGYGALRGRRFEVAARALTEVVGDDEFSEDLMPLVSALLETGRLDDAEQHITGHLRRTPTSPEWLEWAARLASKRGKFDVAVKHYQRLLEDRGDTTAALNNAAWARLMAGKLDDEAERLAKRAVESEGKTAMASLHTLALVQLERGKVKSGVDTLRSRLLRLPEGRLEGADWYVIGRLAEVFGYPLEARDAYSRITDDADDETKVLKGRRLAKLGGGK